MDITGQAGWRWSLRALLAALLTAGVMGGGAPAAGARVGGHAARASAAVAHPRGLRSALGRTSRSAAQLRTSSRRVPGVRKADAVAKPGGEVVSLRRRDSDTFLAGDGRLVTRIYPSAVNYPTKSGALAPINTALVTDSSGSGYAQKANGLGVVLPKNAKDPASLSDSGGGLSVSVKGAKGSGVVSGSGETFAGALSGVNLSLSSLNVGIGWQASATAAASARGLKWVLSPSSGLTAKLEAGGVVFRNAAGHVVWTFAAPTAYVTGTDQPVAVKLSLAKSLKGVVLSITPKASAAAANSLTHSAFLAPDVVGTASPLTFAGVVGGGTGTYLSSAQQTGDCYIDSTNATTSYCLGATNYVGPDDHTLLNFDVADNLPSHVQVLQAYVAMTVSSQSSTTAETIGVWQSAQAWNNLASWDSYDGNTNWTTAGGDTTGAMEDQQSIGASGAVGNRFYWDINPSMQGWVDGNPPVDDGLMFAATAGASAPNTIGFDTETSSTSEPYIGVTYEPRMGDYAGSKYDTQQLTDRSTFGVSDANGDLMISNNDLNLAGVNGLGLSIGRFYNNLSSDQDSFGVGWSMGSGADTYLEIPVDENNTMDYFDGTGNAQLFDTNSSGQWVYPPGNDDVVTMNGASTYASSSFSLYERHAGLTETFTAAANTAPKLAQLSSIADRNGNTIHYYYNSSHQLTSIVDSYGNTTTIDWSSSGYIDKITDPTGRVSHYNQNYYGQLISYEDPAGDTTYYTYNNEGNLTQVSTPVGRVANFTYDDGSTNAVTSVQRLINPSDDTGPTTSYQYATASGTCPAGSGATQATIKDPNGHVSTDCSDDLGRITLAVDALGHQQATSYTADGFISSLMSPLGTPTAFSYASGSSDNLTMIQTGGTGGLTQTLSYGDPTNNPYLPTTDEDAQGNTQTTVYNTTGNATSTTDQLTSQNQATETYNSNGTVATSTDADGNQTIYTYTGGNLTGVTPPLGSGLNPIQLYYDSANRVDKISTVSGSTGHEVDYTYDDLDHISQAVYKNAAGSTVATIGYGYDGDGNLTSRTDSAGTTYYTYDGLDRLISESFPDGSSDTYTYDNAGNLASIQDAGGTVKYLYNAANELTSITDPSGKTAATFTYDADGNLLSTTYPSGVSITRTYNAEDQLMSMINTYKNASNQAAHLSSTLAYTGDLIHTNTDQTGAVTTYTYDALNRLTEAKTTLSGTTTADYQYTLDGNGNLLKQVTPTGTTSYAYNTGNEACWAYAGTTTATTCSSPPSGAGTYLYDGDGNLTQNEYGTTLAYNALGQMTSLTQGGTTHTFSYLGEGQDELTADDGYTLHNDLLGLASVTNGSTSDYFTRSTSGQQVDERQGSTTLNYLYNAQGSIIGLTNSSGHLVNQYAYDPYGNTTTSTGSAPNYFGFDAGLNTNTGLQHFGARYYDASDDRWTQEDPLNQVNDLTQADRYAFAADDPITLSDPLGTKAAVPSPALPYHGGVSFSDLLDDAKECAEGVLDFKDDGPAVAIAGCVINKASQEIEGGLKDTQDAFDQAYDAAKAFCEEYDCSDLSEG